MTAPEMDLSQTLAAQVRGLLTEAGYRECRTSDTRGGRFTMEPDGDGMSVGVTWAGGSAADRSILLAQWFSVLRAAGLPVRLRACNIHVDPERNEDVMTERVDHWYLRPHGAATWTEVDRETWLAAERAAGFIAQHRGEPATTSWSGAEQEGRHTAHAKGCLQPVDMGHSTCPVASDG